ncbi:MAG: PAS domain-containing protein, partial [Sutterellaceae bacterium]|nr:PAS domain-containing protein [Burkholderiaceae bacterium]MDW8430995.1 PAS domain-containing protein [Sutterellaceae bacterium]
RMPRARWDEQTLKIFGLDPRAETPSREEWLRMVLPEDQRVVTQADNEVPPRGEVRTLTYRIRRPDGEIRHLQSRRACLYDDTGQPVRVYGAVIDVTDHMRARSERDALLERMQVIAESVGVGIWDWDPVAHASSWNDRMYELFGRPREWFTERTWLDAVHPEDRATARERMAEALAHGDRFDIEFRVPWPDSSVRWIAARGRVLRDGQGRAVRMIGVNVDVTAHRRAEQEARELLARMQLATEAAGVGIWELELPTLRMHWDEQTFRLVGRRPDEFADLSAQWTCVIHPDDMPAMRAAQRRALKELQPFELEMRVVRPDGEVRYVVLRGQVQCDALGRPAKQFGVVIDVTERRRAEDALRAKEAAERANQAKTEFLSRVSHELRTPLNAILGFTQILELDREQPLSPVQRQRVQHIQQAGWHLLALIDEILDLSRIETGKAKLTFSAVALTELVDECLPLVAPDAERRHITMTVAREKAPVAWADRTRIKQVLINLLSNAVKYNRDGGNVHVMLDTDAFGNALIAVRDTGHGLSARQIEQLFQPFNRLGLEGAPVPGTGIGLALSRSLIEQMRGRLEVSSELQVGTEFRVTLPAARPAAATLAPSPMVTLTRSDVRGGVLYVEDNADNVAVVEQLLAMRPNVRLFTAADGATARVLAAVCQPDLILLDMRLPDIDGFALFDALRAQPETRAIPCVALSANVAPADIARARAVGFVDYWTKPLNAQEFLRKIDALLVRH